MSLVIHGSVAAASATITRAALRAELRTRLSDPAGATWADAALNGWIDAALDDISRHAPRVDRATITVAAGVREYSLAALGALAVLRVEYPAARQPAVFLRRAGGGSDQGGPGAYDVRPPATLILGDAPGAGEALCVLYTARRRHPAGDASPVDLPAEYLAALYAYVGWQAALERCAAEMRNPTLNSLLLSLLDGAAMHAERAYSAALKTAAGQGQATVSTALPDRWRCDPWA